MAGGDLLGTSISGLLAFQRGLAVTGHNVANATTAGYSRQRVDLVTRPPTPSGDGFIGNGVAVNTVERVVNDFITSQLNAATANNSSLQAFYRLASQVDNLLADPQAGLAPGLQTFFDAVSGVANDPASVPARQVLLAEAQALTDRFHYIDQRVEELRSRTNTQIGNSVNEINAFASGIADLNRQILLFASGGTGQPANDLLDQRDELVRKLSERVAVTTSLQDDGALNVFIGSGQTLVIGSNATGLTAANNPYDPTRKEIAITTGPVTSIVSDLLRGGGTLGGVLAFRDEVLDPTQNTLGRTAIALADTFNAQHRLGQDLSGALGGDFFNAIDNISPRVLSTSAGVVDANVTDSGALTVSDYRLDFAGGNYSLTRLSDNAVVYGPNAAFPAGPIDGLSFTLAGVPAAGSSWLIQPTRTGARDIALALSNASRIAAAAPLRSAETTNASGVPTNVGSGSIGAGTVTNTTGLPLAGNITLTFNPNAGGAGVPGFVVAGGPATPILYNPATQSAGVSYTFPNHGGFTFTISGVPQSGDSFVVSNNSGGTGDNRNALTLAGLRDRGVLDGGSTSLTASYGQLVVNTGATTHRVDISRNAQQTLLNNVVAERESVSGVNLDEEAANLLRFQQAYQAAAQMIGVTDTIFQTLLGAVRR